MGMHHDTPGPAVSARIQEVNIVRGNWRMVRVASTEKGVPHLDALVTRKLNGDGQAKGWYCHFCRASECLHTLAVEAREA